MKIMKAKTRLQPNRNHYTICSGGKHAQTSELSRKAKAECRLITQTGNTFRILKRAHRATEGLWLPNESGYSRKQGMWQMRDERRGEGMGRGYEDYRGGLLERHQEDHFLKINRRTVNKGYRRNAQKTEKKETVLELLMKHI